MSFTRISLVLAYAAALAGSLWLGYQLRFDFAVPKETGRTFLLVFAWVISFKLVCLWRLRQFEALVGYFSLPDFSRLFWVLLATSFIVFGISAHLGSDYAPPRSVVLVDFSFSVLGLTAIRLGFRQARTRADGRIPSTPRQRARRAGIVGAGLVGTALAQEFATRRDLGLQAVAFFDDDRMKWGKRVQNVPVVGAPETLLNDKMDLELEEVTTGQAKVSQLRSVEVQDLLGREQVRLATDDIQHLLRDRVVMVTGAGGSIGSELCRQIAGFSPRHLLLVEQSEVQLFQIEQDLIHSGCGEAIVPLVANILDQRRLDYIFRHYHPQVIFHAAAHKPPNGPFRPHLER